MPQCQYCKHTFVREYAYLRHNCDEKKRAERMSTPTGQAAYQIYCKWMREKRRTPVDPEIFPASTVFNSICDFAEFVAKSKVNVDVYVMIVSKNDLHPSHWMRDDVYSLYLEYIDRSMKPADWMADTAKTFMKMSDVLDCDTNELLALLEVPEMMQLIRDRKFSPWILLHSSSFKVWLSKKSPEEQRLIQELIRPMYWMMRFDKNPDDVKRAKTIVAALGI